MGKKARSTKVSTRQRKFVKAKLEGKSSSQAAREAGYAESVARKADAKVSANPVVQQTFKDLMEKAGITDDLLAKRLKEGLSAKETKFFAKDGKVVDTRNVVHHGERRAHLELSLKMKGHLIDKHEIVGKLTLAELVEQSMNADKEKN